ncbi:hypothetical protein P1S91_19425, partial [Escherichia coli]|uniref:hypothetical protein n=1 Tax=Escherichia coli TaxID=562 RepID=UPI0007E91B42
FIKSPVLCCGEDITFNQVAKFTVPLHFLINGEGAGQKAGSLSLNNSMISVHAKSDLPAHIIT